MRYLLITFFRKPNGQIDEQIQVSKRLKKTDLSMCNVILDFALKKVEKCIIEGKVHDTDWDRLYDYYKQVYPSLFEQLSKEAPIDAKIK
jgi:hypothetical protein